MSVLSLRARLAIIILAPLVLISALLGYWRFTVARQTVEELFDRTLLAASLAIARDVAISGGDALSVTTRDLMRDISGGQIYYHVHGPDGVFITGYATPPVPPGNLVRSKNRPVFFRSVYRNREVRVVQLREMREVDGISGYSTVTVWQTFSSRNRFVRDLALRATAIIASLIFTVAAVVWFGIKIGLRPLTDLQTAISRRSSSDLGLIRRPLPREISGLVKTLNSLFEQLARAMESRDVFISNAAHQLRNPIAGVLSMAEAARSARTFQDARIRTAELVEAAKHASRLASQLLSYERVRARPMGAGHEVLDLLPLVKSVLDHNARRVMERDIDLAFTTREKTIRVRADEVLISEAVENLVDNALVHAGPHLSRISMTAEIIGREAKVSICDDGEGIADEDRAKALERFTQIQPGAGSGLGLSIVRAIMKSHGGRVVMEPVEKGTCVSIYLPLAE